MTWLRLDDEFLDHPKIVGLTDRELRAWLRILLYCARYRTAGVIPSTAHRALGLTGNGAKRWRDLGLVDDENGGLTVHDFARYNPRDPTNADRQARHRARQSNAPRNGEDNDDSNANSNVTPRAGVGRRARPVPNPIRTEAAAEATSEDSAPAAAANEDLETLLKQLHWNHGQRQAGLNEPDRARAWVLKAQHVAQRNPGGYAWSGFDGGEWPSDHAPTENGQPTKPLTQILEAFVRGPGRHYNHEAILDEIGIHERKRNELLTDTQKNELLELANQLRKPDGVE